MHAQPATTLIGRRVIGSWMIAMATTAAAWAQAAPTAAVVPSDAEIRRILVERIDTHRQSVGLVVGVIEPTGRRVVAYGSLGSGNARPLDGNTVFEIGSITKVFTSLLLADAIQRHEVALTDPVAMYLPSQVTVPQRAGRSITLHDLSTHSSGLPRLPDNMNPKDPLNPYADYSVEQLYQFLSGYRLTRDIGTEYEYSNLGAGLLGHALTQKAGMDYEALVRARITGPLGMGSTGIALTPDMKARLSPGHGPALEPSPNWDVTTLAGAGALRSSTNDMLTFLAAALGYTSSPLAPALAAMTATRRPGPSPSLEMGLGWHILKDYGTEIIWHNGGTGGYRSWIGYDPRARTGVVILSNAGTLAGPDDIGRHLLNQKFPLLQGFPQAPAPPKPRIETKVAPSVFDRYVGRYQFAPTVFLTITRDDTRLLAQLTGQPAYEIFAESEKDYFLKIVDAQLTFETDAQNKPIAVVLRQNGADQRAPKIEGEPVMPKETVVDPAVLERYVGRYQFAPGVVMTITRQQGRLFGQPTGQSIQEIFASDQKEFFLKTVNAQISFETDAQGRAVAIVVHQNGVDTRAARIE